MAPVLVSASYLDRAGAVRDTILAVYSEPIKETNIARPLLFNRFPDIESYGQRLELERLDSVSALFSVVSVENQTTPRDGDSVWINDSAGIADAAANRQNNPANIRRRLDYYQLFGIESAIYHDRNADGLIDRIGVALDRPANTDLLDALYETISLPEHRQFTYSRSDLRITDDGFEINVEQPTGIDLFTGVDDRDTLRVARTLSESNGLVYQSAVGIDDRIAPVATLATYHPAVVLDPDVIPADTLRVTFSEPIAAPRDQQPFIFYDRETGKQYRMTLDPLSTGDRTRHAFLVIDSEKPFPRTGDSLTLDPGAGIVDSDGNTQARESRRAVLLVKAYRISYDIVIGPNPLTPRSSAADETASYEAALQASKARKGAMILVKSLTPPPADVHVTVTVRIQDAVGNSVVNPVERSFDHERGLAFYYWNGTNERGRRVAGGTYAVLVSVEDSEGGAQSFRRLVGIVNGK
jgi:hypothetical protein